MAYLADKKPGELTALTSLATDDVIIVGDTSDASEVAKGITKANLITDLTTSFATAGHNHTGVYAPALGADDNYVTDAEKIVIGNTSGTNTGDNAVNSNYSGLVTNATHTGDVTGATALTIAAKAVTLAKMDDVATASVFYRKTAGTGAPEVQTLATLKTDLGLSNTNSGDQTSIVGITGTKAQFDTAVTDGNFMYVGDAPTSHVHALSEITDSTSEALGVGTLEVGHATDTTLSRVSAGVIAVEGKTILTTDGGTLTGSITLGENTSIALDPAGSADGKYSGITITGTGGATIAFGDLVTLDKDDSRWELVDISVAAAATGDARGILGMAVTSSSDGGALTVLLNGIIRADANFPALTIGAPVYASTTGDVVVTQPTTTDYVIRQVGYALTADEIYFNPTGTWVTHT